MENFNEFSSIEQAAMEQSPSHDTDVRHNFMSASDFIHAIEKGIEDIGKGVEDATKHVTPETPEIAETVAAAAGGVIKDGVFSERHANLLKSIDQECSVAELIDLRNSLNNANRMLK